MPNFYLAGAILVALLFSHGWAFNQGKNFEKRAEARRIEATNRKIREVLAREEATAAKEKELRDAAYSEASTVLLTSSKCFATPDIAAALSRIR
jgi:hypothetical protein